MTKRVVMSTTIHPMWIIAAGVVVVFILFAVLVWLNIERDDNQGRN